ncbi:hypothetical protein BB561_002677 [Smittium simulii]|uniref:Uncharacterized protein n=1 Tax=Smittium simulii TaxID=133385 RepID=A0A2T9YPL7_9FUNG|nr:hypothetical protein BB561_002677 [Smittium simulii]
MNQQESQFDISKYINKPPWSEFAIVPIAFYLLVFPEAKKSRFLTNCAGRVKKDSELNICDVRVLRGVSGYALCRYCGKELTTSKQTFCNEICVQEFTIRTQPKIVRQKLLERDNGICALCMFPAHAYYQKVANAESYELAMRILDSLENEISSLWAKKLKSIRIKENWTTVPSANTTAGRELCKLVKPGMFWEAAHIIDIADGGGVCGLNGYRTLCVPCHEIETRNACSVRSNHKFNIDTDNFPPDYSFDTIKKKYVATAKLSERRNSIKHNDISKLRQTRDNTHKTANSTNCDVIKQRRLAWTSQETTALVEGYKKYGKNWVKIKSEYSTELQGRTNTNIKDRFRTLYNNGLLNQDYE